MGIFNAERLEARKARKANWKEYKKNKKVEKKVACELLRESLKEEYADAPVLTRFFHVNAGRIKKAALISVAVLAVLGLTFMVCLDSINNMVMNYFDKVDASEIPEEELYALSPLDDEGAERIGKLQKNNPEDSWTFCVYMVGADLEDVHEDDLSDYVKMITAKAAKENGEAKRNQRLEMMDRYASEINKNGLDVPEYLYKVNKPVASSEPVTDDVIVAERKGAASTDISEMVANVLPDNITIVLQTGGAMRWSNTLVNPNKTQRFVIKDGNMTEAVNMHIQDSCSPDTLADFISYCKDNYESDHMALILWDHGGGVTGFGSDDIFDSGMSLKDLGSAVSKAVKKDVNKPYFDIIGFDACLMATVETAAVFEGYGKYLVASEETEPGGGWDYKRWLKTLADNPDMNAASVGQEIADSYMDFYMRRNNDELVKALEGNIVVTFSVVDIDKACKLYKAYEEMNKKFLKLAADNQAVLTDMSRAAKKTMRYSGSNYDYYNMIDLGTYVDYLSELYPDECEEVRTLLREAVLYKRSNSYLDGSQGLSVYFPTSMGEAYSLFVFTDYVYNISDNPCTNALYYYKVAGCLNDELQKTAADVIGKDIKSINTKIFSDYQKIMPEISDDKEIVINIEKDLEESIQDVYLEIAEYDEAEGTITYYGTGDSCSFEGDGKIVSDIDGQWFAIDGSILDAELSFATDSTATYTTRVLHNGVPSYMTFTVEDDKIAINSVVKIPREEDIDYDAALRANTELRPGDTIVPILAKQEESGQESYDVYGKKIKYKTSTKVDFVNLPSGEYVCSVVITDLRGDRYYSPVVEAYVEGGKVSDIKVNVDFVGRSY